MSEEKPSFAQSLPPHIRSTDSLTKRSWGRTLALLPLLLAACLTGHAQILRVLLLCLVSAVAFEFLAKKLLRKKEELRNGETVLVAVLFSLLMPSRCPSELVILGVFLAVVMGKELFGGTGGYPLPPALMARAILQLSFPKVMAEPMLLAGDVSPWLVVAIGLGGILLLRQKKSYWETPVLFTAVCFICGDLWGGAEVPTAFLSGVLFTAFFLLADPVTLPLTRKGSALFVLGAAILSSTLDPHGFSIGAVVFAVLWMSLLTPWLDVWLKPVPFIFKRLIKATYP